MLKSIPKEEDKVYKDPKNPNMYITFKKQAKVLDELEEIRSKIKKNIQAGRESMETLPGLYKSELIRQEKVLQLHVEKEKQWQ